MTMDNTNPPEAAVHDVYVSGVQRVENIGNGLLRVWCYVNQDAGGEEKPVIVAKIVCPAAAMQAAIEEVQAALRREEETKQAE